jgi:Ca2+-transporting ATPase
MALLPLLFGWSLVLLPVHIVFLELIIDPASSIVFEAEPENPQVMKRPPRNPREPMFGKQALLMGLLQGIGVLAMVLAVFLIAQEQRVDEATTRALTFTTLVIANLGLILANRSHSRLILSTLRTRNAALWWIVGGTLLFLGLILSIPGVRDLFDFSLLSPTELVLCLAAGITSILWFEALKVLTRQHDMH